MTADAAAKGRLAESLIWTAVDLVGLVRGRGGAEAIGEFLAGLGDDERDALPVILAAMVDDGKTPDELLAWVDWDEEGRPLNGPRAVTPRWRTSVDCGTPGAFRRHLVAGEDPCDPCEQAAKAQQERRDEWKRQARQAARQAS